MGSVFDRARIEGLPQVRGLVLYYMRAVPSAPIREDDRVPQLSDVTRNLLNANT